MLENPNNQYMFLEIFFALINVSLFVYALVEMAVIPAISRNNNFEGSIISVFIFLMTNNYFAIMQLFPGLDLYQICSFSNITQSNFF